MDSEQIQRARADVNRGARVASHRIIDSRAYIPFDPAAVAAMVRHHRAGYLDATGVLIDYHMWLADTVAAQSMMKLSAASRRGQGRDDMYGAAYLGLVQGVNWYLEHVSHDNITAYLAVTVRRFCLDYAQADHLIPVERRALGSYHHTVVELGSPAGAVIGASLTAADTRWVDSILKRKLAAGDQLVYDMLLEGATQTEIATRVRCSQATVSRAVARIRSAYDTVS